MHQHVITTHCYIQKEINRILTGSNLLYTLHFNYHSNLPFHNAVFHQLFTNRFYAVIVLIKQELNLYILVHVMI